MLSGIRWLVGWIGGMLWLALGAPLSPAHAGLTFQFTYAADTPQGIKSGFEQAAANWSAVLYDNVTVNIYVDFWNAGGGIALFNAANFEYSQLHTALLSDARTNDDLLSLAHLPAGDSLRLLINRTSNSPHGAGSAAPYLDADGDANNTTVAMTLANAKALGLRPRHDGASDGTILIDESYRTQGSVSARLAGHEIGHILGFMSGVDALDYNSTGVFHPDDYFTFASPLDLVRRSALSSTYGSDVIDWTADRTDKYFSVDGGTTKIASFSTGDTWGNGIQNSHWRLGSAGIMGYGNAGITAADVRAMDVIGWNAVVPEPSAWALAVSAAACASFMARRRRRGAAMPSH